MYKKFLRIFACILIVATASPGNSVRAMQEETMSEVGTWLRNARNGKYQKEKNRLVYLPSARVSLPWDSAAETVSRHLCSVYRQADCRSRLADCNECVAEIRSLGLDPDDEWRLVRTIPLLSGGDQARRNKEWLELATKKINEDIIQLCQQFLIGRRNVKRLRFTVETGEFEYKRTQEHSSPSNNTSNSSQGGGGGEVDVMWGLVKVGGSGGGGSSSSYSYSNSNSAYEIYMKLRPTCLKSLDIEFFED